jgi:hypothetical protein
LATEVTGIGQTGSLAGGRGQKVEEKTLPERSFHDTDGAGAEKALKWCKTARFDLFLPRFISVVFPVITGGLDGFAPFKRVQTEFFKSGTVCLA